MPSTHLTDRAVVLVSGEDAGIFLQNVVTCDIDGLTAGVARLGALLTPQGKILFDFLVVFAPLGAGNFPGFRGYFLDCQRTVLPDLVKRLSLYRLRAKVQIAEVFEADEPLGVVASWGSDPVLQEDSLLVRDERHAELGERQYLWEHDAAAISVADPQDYEAHRIVLGIPEGGKDFPFGDVFPHDADMDQLSGVNFKKGCYIGQEVVSRMEHRHTARRRIVMARGTTPLPAAGTEITAAGRPLGTLGSAADNAGLALVRLDRAKEAMDAGVTLTAAGVPLVLTIPPWAGFGWPSPHTAGEG